MQRLNIWEFNATFAQIPLMYVTHRPLVVSPMYASTSKIFNDGQSTLTDSRISELKVFEALISPSLFCLSFHRISKGRSQIHY